MQDQHRLQGLSGILYWMALVLSVLLPLFVLVFAAKVVLDPTSLRPPAVPPEMSISRWQAGLVAALALVTVQPMTTALRAMARLFDCYRMGEVLSDANAETILTIGRALMLVALFAVLGPTLQDLILSWHAPEKTLSIALEGGTLGFLMAAGLLTVIGWAMRQAAAIKAENEGFV